MGLWIRSQDKKNLVNIQGTNINYNNSGQILGWINPVDTVDYTSAFILGDYDTDERAIEVLDMIQHQLTNCSGLDAISGVMRFYKETVFQMPEK